MQTESVRDPGIVLLREILRQVSFANLTYRARRVQKCLAAERFSEGQLAQTSHRSDTTKVALSVKHTEAVGYPCVTRRTGPRRVSSELHAA